MIFLLAQGHVFRIFIYIFLSFFFSSFFWSSSSSKLTFCILQLPLLRSEKPVEEIVAEIERVLLTLLIEYVRTDPFSFDC